jgi:amino acid transporter
MPDERVMVSERIAPSLLPRVLGTTDMTVIFLAVVLFVVQASVIQPAGPAAYTYWLLGFVLFLVPGALVTAQLGQMFPQEGSLYVWTHKALGPFWGFFAGFCLWFPGVLVMVATADLVVTLWQFVDPGSLTKTWEQMLVILAILWFSAAMSTLRLRVTQSYANVAVLFYGAAVFVIGLAGVLWLVGGNGSANPFSGAHNWLPHASNWTFFGLVILALLGIEVPMNLGVEIKNPRAIKRYLVIGSAVVMAAYLWTTFGNMVTVPVGENNSTTGILTAVQNGFWGSHAFAVVIGLVVIWFFVTNTVVYNYSFARLLFVSGLERRLPPLLGKVNKSQVPVNAVLAQTTVASIFTIVTFGPWAQNGNFPAQVYLVFQATVTVVWCVSTVLLFADVFFVRRAFPQRFEETKVAPAAVLYACGVVGSAASIVGMIVTFKDPWNADLFSVGGWRTWLAIITAASLLVAAALYAVSVLVTRAQDFRPRGIS